MVFTQDDLKEMQEFYELYKEAELEELDDHMSKFSNYLRNRALHFWPEIHRLLAKAIDHGWN